MLYLNITQVTEMQESRFDFVCSCKLKVVF